MNRKSIQIDLKWLFWDKIWSILNWFKHTEDKMVKLKVLLVRRSYTLEYDTWNGILARVLLRWSGLRGERGWGSLILQSYTSKYDTWGYHMSTHIIPGVCDVSIWAYHICTQNPTSRTSVTGIYMWIYMLVKKGGLTVLFLFNKSLLISVGPYKSASQNLTLNFESQKLICQSKTWRGLAFD